jgi:electron transport complex protein RnfC
VEIVTPGDRVSTGQPIARNTTGEQLHSPVTGLVRTVEPRLVTAPAIATVDCLVIERHGDETTFGGYTPPPDPFVLAPESIRIGISQAGIVGLGGAMFPTAEKLNCPDPIRALIVNGAECEPWISCDEMLLRERASLVIAGTRILMRALGAPKAVIAIEGDMPEARVALHDSIVAAGNCGIEMAVVTAKYPAGGERQLVQLLTGIEVPSGGWPRDVGFACQNVGTVAAVADYFTRGRPLISRIVTVTGECVGNPGNYEVRIGTPVRELIDLAGGYRNAPARLIMGGPMMGLALPSDDMPVTKATNCIVAASARELAAPRIEMPCIRCGECVQVCPANLLPQELLNAARTGDTARLEEFGVAECIECGCCDYVCPSYISLTGRFVEGKKLVRERHSELDASEVALRRFEAHTNRMDESRIREARDHDSQADPAAIRELIQKLRNDERPR